MLMTLPIPSIQHQRNGFVQRVILREPKFYVELLGYTFVGPKFYFLLELLVSEVS